MFERFLLGCDVCETFLTESILTHSAPGSARAIISSDKYNQLQTKTDNGEILDKESKLAGAHPDSSMVPEKGE